MRRSVSVIAGCLFLSGMCALIYQVAWMHELRLVFGGSTAAMGAVLAIFMAGLGLGNSLLGRRADATTNPLRLYGVLELMIAVSAAATPFLIDIARAAYVGLGGQTMLGVWGATGLRLGLSVLVLGLPTFLMGGTLPAAAMAATDPNDPARRKLAVLYGLNTLGAVAGTLLSTFWLVELLGVRAALWSAAAVNVIAAVIALVVSTRQRSAEVADAASIPADAGNVGHDSHPGALPNVMVATSSSDEALATEDASGTPHVFVYLSAACVGFSFLLMELVWNRMLTPLLGGSSFTFGLILAIALLGIGVGSLAYTVLFRNRTPTLELFAFTCGLEALALAIPFALGDQLAIWTAVNSGTATSFFGQVVLWAILTSVVVLPAAIVSGLQFPLLIALLGRADKNLGRQAGLATSCNTFGAIFGSLAGGFGALPLLTAPVTWQLVTGVLGTLGIAGVVLSASKRRPVGALILPMATITLAFLCLKADGPTAVWRHSSIGAGRARLTDKSPNAIRRWVHEKRRRIGWEAEGVESSVALEMSNGLAFFVNGKIDGHALLDVGTQVMLGQVGAILHGNPTSALVVGLGTGETAGWLGAIESMKQVDVVELEPAIIEVARRCATMNCNVLDNPNVHVVFNDAREVLLTTNNRYDLIVSEPSNPYRAGIAGLFTQEFYQASQKRLADRGVFVQWLQAYEIDAQTVHTVFATLSSVFPHVEVWQTNSTDLLLACAMEPIEHDVVALRERLARPIYRQAMQTAWRATDLEGFLARHVAGPDLIRELLKNNSVPLNTDDRNCLEYGFARTVGKKQTGFSIVELRQAAAQVSAHRPRVTNGEPNWTLVEDERIAMHVFQRELVPPSPDWTDGHQQRAEAQTLCRDGKFAEAIEMWGQQSREPSQLTETAILAFAHASLGHTDVVRPLIERLRTVAPNEALGIDAVLQFHAADFEQCERILEQTILGLRDDPWGMDLLVDAVLVLPQQLAQRDRTKAAAMLKHLTQPLAGLKLQERRMGLACNVANLVDATQLARAIEAFEPHVPWTKPFLELRLRAYAKSGHRLVEIAERDLLRFQVNSGAVGEVAESKVVVER